MRKILINILLIISVYLLYIAFFTDNKSICSKPLNSKKSKNINAI
jgi:hypothetical protein